MRIAQIMHNKAHWIFESEEIPDYPPTSEGEYLRFIDITNKPHVQEGWHYDNNTGDFSEPTFDNVVIETELTLEEMQAQTLLNTEYLVVMSELTNLLGSEIE